MYSLIPSPFSTFAYSKIIDRLLVSGRRAKLTRVKNKSRRWNLWSRTIFNFCSPIDRFLFNSSSTNLPSSQIDPWMETSPVVKHLDSRPLCPEKLLYKGWNGTRTAALSMIFAPNSLSKVKGREERGATSPFLSFHPSDGQLRRRWTGTLREKVAQTFYNETSSLSVLLPTRFPPRRDVTWQRQSRQIYGRARDQSERNFVIKGAKFPYQRRPPIRQRRYTP